MTDGEGHGAPDAVAGPESATTETMGTPGEAAASTVGTGSTLGVGCLIVVILFVAVAFAARYLFGLW